MRKWENAKKSHFFFVLFFQHRPVLTLCEKSTISTITNHRKSQEKKVQVTPPNPRPIPRRRAAFCSAEGRRKPTRKRARNHPPKNHPENTPKTTPKNPPKTAPKTPRQNPSRNRADNHTPPPQNLPRVLLGPDWVRPGSGLGPHLILWKVYHIPLHFHNHRDTFQPTKNPP